MITVEREQPKVQPEPTAQEYATAFRVMAQIFYRRYPQEFAAALLALSQEVAEAKGGRETSETAEPKDGAA